jgi:hypothetical protein
MKACVVLTPNRSKRLIAQGVVALPQIQSALASGTIVITLGTTNAYVAEALLHRPVDHGAFAAGFIDDRYNVNARVGEAREIVLRQGEPVEVEPATLLDSLRAGDVLVKGANALDPWGTAGVLMGSKTGGTVGRYVIAALSRGVDLVIPVGLSKTIHTPITELARELGSGRIELSMGLSCGMAPLVGRVVTEIDALEALFPVTVTQVTNGGVGPGEGAVSLLIAGEDDAVRGAFERVTGLPDEPEDGLTGRV